MPTNLQSAPEEAVVIMDGLVDLLNEGEFSVENLGQAERFFTVEQALGKMVDKGLRVAVLYEAQRRKKATRRSREIEFDVNVAVLRKLDQNETEIDCGDSILSLAGELVDYIEDNPLETPELNQRHTNTAIRAPYSPIHLREQRLFLCPASLTYLVFV